MISHPSCHLILAQFLKNHEAPIRRAIANDDLAEARKLVNGGGHGLDKFEDTFDNGLDILPR
jgi:putative chitinase